MYSLALLSVALGACLPRGTPPAGRQILSDHAASLMGFAPPHPDGVERVLFFRPGDDADTVDLWALALDASGGASSELLLQKGLSSSYQLSYRPAAESGSFRSDARGRLYFSDTRVDPATGESTDLGGSLLNLSDRGQDYLVQDSAGRVSLHRADDSVLEIDDGMFPYFLGDTVYYVTNAGDVMRIPPGGGPELMAKGDVSSFYPLPGNPQLWMLIRVIPDPNAPEPSDPIFGPGPTDMVSAAILDTTTGTETPLPDGMAYQFGTHFSPDGHWLITSKAIGMSPSGFGSQYTNVLIDRLTGSIEVLDQSFQFGSWRPGHDEIWATGYDETQPGLAGSSLFIKKPGQPVVVIPGIGYGGFTEDGKYWISASAPPTEIASEQVIGLADDPAGPKVRLVPPHTSLIGMWTLPDGRMVVQSVADAANYFEDFFTHVVDPSNGATQLVGEHGVAEAVGQTRVLGLFHVSYERGDLVSFDVTRGKSTTLASEFAMGAVAEPQGDDKYAPGTPIVYQYRARFESQWDGLWLATAP